MVQVSVLCVAHIHFGFCWYIAVALRNATAVLGKEPVHSVPQTLSGFVVTEDTPLTSHEPKFKVDGSQKLTDEKRPSHAASSGRKSQEVL